MNKTQLVDIVAEKAELTKVAAANAVEAILGGIKGALEKGDSVSLIGHGTYVVSDRAARECRNPKTGEMIKIKKTKVVRFKPGKVLKEAVKA